MLGCSLSSEAQHIAQTKTCGLAWKFLLTVAGQRRISYLVDKSPDFAPESQTGITVDF